MERSSVMAIGKALTPSRFVAWTAWSYGCFAACNASPDWPKILLDSSFTSEDVRRTAMSIIRLIHIKIDPVRDRDRGTHLED